MKNTNNNQTEIGEVSEVLLQDYCDVIQYGYTQSASEKEVGPKFLRITDIQNKPINWNEVPYCEISEKDLKKYLLETGDIVIARTGASTGTNAIYDSKKMPQSVFASYLIRLKLNEEFDPLYVHYFLQSPFYKEHIAGILGGSAQPNANAQQLTNVQITKFDPDYQRQITTVLSSLDDKIELNRRMNKTLEDMGKTLFKRWFVNFEFPNEEGKPYKSSGGGMVESKLGEIPQGWKIKDLGEIFEINTKSINPSKHPDQVFWHFSIPSYDQYDGKTWSRLPCPVFLPENVLHLGAGTTDCEREEKVFLDTLGVRTFSAKELNRNCFPAWTALKELSAKVSALSVSFDLDAIDKVSAPAVHLRSNGGLTRTGSLWLCGEIAKSGKLRTIDLVEYKPSAEEFDEDGVGRTIRLARDLLLRLLGR